MRTFLLQKAGSDLTFQLGFNMAIEFGEKDGNETARLSSFVKVCQRAGIEAEISTDIELAQWQKLVFLPTSF